MKKYGKDQPPQDWQDHFTGHHLRKGAWRRIHHSWIFWVVLVMMFFSIGYYIMSVDFAFAPHNLAMPKMQSQITK